MRHVRFLFSISLIGCAATLAHGEPWHPPRLALHARQLSFVHPLTQAELSFVVPLPRDLSDWLQVAAAEASAPL